MSHTHAGANVNSQLADKPGGELIEPYIEHLTEQIGAAILEARAALAPAWVTYGTGRCALATNRDFWDAEAQRFAAGYNPDAPADDTLLVARVTGEDGELRATLFNYACHPTTLAWENRLLSPDYIGAAREVLESAFGAPALFLQGASGELAPRDDYVGDTAVADRNGRQLGHAAAAAIESLPPPGTRFVYTGIVASGANLGTWEYQPCDAEQLRASEQLAAQREHASSCAARRTSASSRASPARLPTRCRSRRRRCAAASSARRSATARSTRCRSGPGGSATRCWSRSRTSPTRCSRSSCGGASPGRPLLVLGVTNRTMGYLSPEETYGTGLYQEQQSPFAPGCLEQTIEVAAEALEEMRGYGIAWRSSRADWRSGRNVPALDALMDAAIAELQRGFLDDA